MLVLETTYSRYLSRMWVTVDPNFEPVKSDPDKTTWNVSRKPSTGRAFSVAASLTKGKGVLKMPEGTFQIERLPVVNTVLLLCAAGIPARYGRGYLVHEFSKLENRFVVRASHAHTWALVYLDGAWHNFDTTPGSWMSIENAANSKWQVFKDFWSWCRFNLSKA